MPVTSNVAWDERLEEFKGRDTTEYVLTAAITAKVCASCRLPLRPGASLSLAVNIIDGTEPDGTAYLAFDPSISHRKCREPAVSVTRRSGAPVELRSIGAQFTLGRPGGSREGEVAVLAYTLVPSVCFREPGGELVSAHVAALLSQGFGLSFSADLADILQQARPVEDSTVCSVTRQGLLSLELDGETMYSRRLDPGKREDAAWLQAAHGRDVLVISGDNLDMTGSGLDVTAAARLGTLVAGRVHVTT